MVFINIFGRISFVKEGNSNLGVRAPEPGINKVTFLLLTSKNKNLLFYLAGRQITHEQSLLKGCRVIKKF